MKTRNRAQLFTQYMVAQPHGRGENITEQTESVLWKGSTPYAQGKDFLARRNTCKMSEMYSLSLCGVSRRCPPTATAHPAKGCSSIDTNPTGRGISL